MDFVLSVLKSYWRVEIRGKMEVFKFIIWSLIQVRNNGGLGLGGGTHVL